MNEGVRRTIQLLAQGQVVEAKRLAQTTTDALERTAGNLVERLQQIDADLDVLRAVLGTETPTSPRQAKPEEDQLGRASRTETRLLVLAASEVVARESGANRVTTDTVYARMQGASQNPPSKTAIGNVLAGSKDWRRLGRGVYQRIIVNGQGSQDDLPF